MAKREVYERADGKWGWRLKADNGQVVATDGNQGYESLASCEKMADAVVGGSYAHADKVVTRQ